MHEIWTNFLRVFMVIQFRDLDNPKYSKARLNPWNPLSYIILLIFFIGYLFAYGFKGLRKKIKLDENPFKWSDE